MARIHRLSAEVVTRIAAGEVIERPASVVKELLENAIDACATRIDVELEQGGVELIRVVDNGCGIHPEDLPLAFATHATSKLRTADDLFRISTKGFRGEALASIGGVAKVLLQSRPGDAITGAEIRCDGGTVGSVRPWGGAVGTRVDVRHLFYSVPARKKFLKSAATELGRITDIVEWIALSHPELHIVLRHNQKLVYDIPATAGFLDRISLFFGAEIRQNLYEIDSGPISSETGLRVQGWIGDPSIDRGNSKLQYLFVNGRWFRDRSLGYAIQEAYRNLIMTGRYPVAFVYLTIPPDQVDVNAHPTKAEVRFVDNALVFSLIRATIKNRLLQENLVPRFTVSESSHERASSIDNPLFSPRKQLAEQTVGPWEIHIPSPRPIPVPEAPPDLPVRVQPLAAPTESVEAQPEPEQAHLPQVGSFPLPTNGVALQVHDAYLVQETAEGMIVIDQHALHERILFEQLRNRIRAGKLEVQRLLIPEPIDLPANQVAAVLEVQDSLAELGLEVAEFGGNTIILSSYPTILSRRSPHVIMQGVIDYLVTQERLPAKEVMLDHLLATMACKAAVKAGDRLTPEEIVHLLELRQLAEESHHCPHGRPTSLIFSRQDLDRQFRRR